MALVLQLPNFDHTFVVEWDTSDIDAVLHQGGEPVAFFSCQIAPRQTKLAAYERELIGLCRPSALGAPICGVGHSW
jgi:hypothetical protein